MWILHFLPDAFILWFCNILLLVGIVLTIAGFFAHRIPLVWQYQLPFKFVGIALLVLGVYFRGGYAVEMQWRERVAEVEAKLAQAEKASQEANVKLETKGKEKIRVIKEKGEVIKQYIDREITKYDATCNIPNEVVKAHNAAAKNEAIR
jgi:preprotein translocase subunit SecF